MDALLNQHASHGDVSLAMISHDFKSLVNTVVCAADLLALELGEKNARESGDMTGHQYADVIRLAGADMMLLVNSILHMSEVHKLEEQMAPRRIHDMQGEMLKVLTAFSSISAMKNIRLELDVDPNIPHVVWDMDKLRIHVINNVVSNALRHSPSGGRVLIRVADTGHDTVTIRISDSGPGIPVEDRDHVFHKSWHGDIARERVCGRSGLGLFNAMLVARAHGGNITVVDDPVDTGATFQIELPYVGVVVTNEHNEYEVESNAMPFIAAQEFVCPAIL